MPTCGSSRAAKSKPPSPRPTKTQPSKPNAGSHQRGKALRRIATSVYDLLYDGTCSAESTLQAAQKQIEELARYDAEPLPEAAQQLASTLAIVAGRQAPRFATTPRALDASPDRLAEIENRLAALDRLKRKYGSTLADVLAFGEEAARKLAEVENRDESSRTCARTSQSRRAAYRDSRAIASLPTAQPLQKNWRSLPKPRSTTSP